jgi:hypothetical protein
VFLLLGVKAEVVERREINAKIFMMMLLLLSL